MTDKVYIKLNTSLSTCSNSATLEHNADGDIKGSIELRLPENISSAPCSAIDLQTSKLRLSMANLPVAFVPVNPDSIDPNSPDPIPTLLWIGIWFQHVENNGSITPENSIGSCPATTALINIPRIYETLDIAFAKQTGYLPIRNIETLVSAINTALDLCYTDCLRYPIPVGRVYIPDFEWHIGEDHIQISFTNIGSQTKKAAPFGTPGVVKQEFISSSTPWIAYRGSYDRTTGAELWNVDNESYSPTYGFNIIANTNFRNLFHFMPWLRPINRNDLGYGQQIAPPAGIPDDMLVHVLNIEAAQCTTERENGIYVWGTQTTNDAFGTRFRYRWDNMPTILLSPVSSIVILMDGIGVTQQILPINMKQPQGSSLTTSIPVIENYFPLTTSLRDLHDDLLISRETFDDTALMSVPPHALRARSLNFRAAFITKDGQLYDLYIPPTGTFMLQLTFCLHR